MKNNKTFINKHLQADDAANNRASSNRMRNITQ